MRVVSALKCKDMHEAGRYQDYLYDTYGYNSEIRRYGEGFLVVTVKKTTEAKAPKLIEELESLEWNGRSPEVTTSTRRSAIDTGLPKVRGEDDELSEDRRRNYRKTETFREAQRRYQQSPQGREAQRRYASSGHGKERRKAYEQSERGKEARKEYQRRRRAAEKTRRAEEGEA